MEKLFRYGIITSAMMSCVVGSSGVAHAGDWPQSDKPVTIVVPSSAGGAADLTARSLGKYLSEKAGIRTVVVDKPGAGGIIGTVAVKSANADGYTFLLSTNSTQAANQYLYKTLPYDPDKDFVNIGMLGLFSTVAVVSPDSSINSLKELVSQAKTEPGKLFFGYYSSSSRVPPNLLKEYAKIDVKGASYKNVTQILVDLRGKLIQFAFVDYLTAKAQIEGGNLKPIAVTGNEREPQLPTVNTTTSDYPGFTVQGWMGISAPAGTPSDVVEKMNRYINDALQDPETNLQFKNLGLQPKLMSTDDFSQYIKDDAMRWEKWVKAAGITPQ